MVTAEPGVPGVPPGERQHRHRGQQADAEVETDEQVAQTFATPVQPDVALAVRHWPSVAVARASPFRAKGQLASLKLQHGFPPPGEPETPAAGRSDKRSPIKGRICTRCSARATEAHRCARHRHHLRQRHVKHARNGNGSRRHTTINPQQPSNGSTTSHLHDRPQHQSHRTVRETPPHGNTRNRLQKRRSVIPCHEQRPASRAHRHTPARPYPKTATPAWIPPTTSRS